MRIAITGAMGFVGMNVARTLALAGHEVVAVARREPDAWVRAFTADVAERIFWRRADLQERGALARALSADAFDVLIHAAVITATTQDVEREDSLDIVSVNIGGTMDALDVSRAHHCTRFVYISSPSAIGPVAVDKMMDESIYTAPDTLYGITKRASEQLVQRYGAIHDLPTVSVRISQPYGPGERATASRVRTSPIHEWLCAARSGAVLVTGPRNAARDWTYIDDTARGIMALVTAPTLAHSLYHLGVGHEVSVGDVLDLLQSAFPDLSWDNRAEASGLNPNIAGLRRRWPLDCRRFATEFGWSPSIDIRDGMQRYLAWASSTSS